MAGGGCSIGGCEHELAARGAYVRVREVRHELADRSRVEALPGIGEHHDLAADDGHERVDDRRLPTVLMEGAHRDAESHIAQRLLDRAVGRSIRPDHDLELVPRIVQRQQVLDAGTNPLRFVVSDHNDGDGRLDGRAQTRLRPQPGAECRHERVPDVDVNEQDQRHPEECVCARRPRHCHQANEVRVRPRACPKARRIQPVERLRDGIDVGAWIATVRRRARVRPRKREPEIILTRNRQPRVLQ